MNKVTLKDIASAAGVSVSTVSQVVNQSNLKVASTETVNKIYSVIKEMGYKSFHYPKKQFSGESNLVGLLIGSHIADKYSNSYYSNYYKGIEDELHKEGYLVDFYYTISQVNKSEIVYEQIMSSTASSLIIIDGIKNEYAKPLHDKFSNIVYIGMSEFDFQENDSVLIDLYHITRQVLNRLIHSGRKRILITSGDVNIKHAILGEKLDNISNGLIDPRTLAYKDELKESGIPFDKDLIVSAESWNPQKSYEAILKLIKSNVKFDAIFAANDNLAVGCLNALTSSNIKVPAEVALIGFDDQPDSFCSTPSISTFHIPSEELGRTAVQILLLRIAGKLPMQTKVYLPINFITRDTCGLK